MEGELWQKQYRKPQSKQNACKNRDGFKGRQRDGRWRMGVKRMALSLILVYVSWLWGRLGVNILDKSHRNGMKFLHVAVQNTQLHFCSTRQRQNEQKKGNAADRDGLYECVAVVVALSLPFIICAHDAVKYATCQRCRLCWLLLFFALTPSCIFVQCRRH